MTTIAEYPTSEYSVSNRAIKIAVIGGSGVGKTGKRKKTNKHIPSLYFECFTTMFLIVTNNNN